MKAPSGGKILNTCMNIAEMLIQKNVSYGDSALSPINIFASSTGTEQIATRIDDKLNRIKNAQSFPGDNDIEDLIGYLILYKISKDQS